MRENGWVQKVVRETTTLEQSGREEDEGKKTEGLVSDL